MDTENVVHTHKESLYGYKENKSRFFFLSGDSLRQVAQAAEGAEQLGQAPTGLHLQPGGGADPQPSVHLPCQRRACLQ